MWKPAALLLALAVIPVPLRADDLDTLQGSWETTIRQNDKTLQVIKTIAGQRETLEVFAAGVLIRRHEVDFELADTGDVKTFAYTNGRITFGPGAGNLLPDGKYIYRLTDDRWIGVFGALNDDTGPVYIEVFRRVAEKPKEPGA